MSRKRAIMSNTPQVGILADRKSSKYNQLILEALFEKELTAWELSEIIKEKMPSKEKIENALEKRYHTQKIYSVIQRKNGRLDDLKNKGYVTENNGVWSTTKKALIALSIDKPELINSKMQSNKEKFTKLFDLYIENNKNVKNVFGLSIDLSKMKPFFEKVDFGYLFELIIEEAKVLLTSGIELDRISEDDFLSIIYSALITKGKISEIIKKLKKD